MSKRRSTSDDIMELTAMFPWWVGVSLAIASYLFLHHVASSPVESLTATGTEAFGPAVRNSLTRALSTFGSFVLPLLFLAGAFVSWIGKRRRLKLHQRARSGGRQAIAGMNWQDFERLTHEVFLRQGYSVVESRRGPDGGVDLQLLRAGKRVLVQCKHRRQDVGVKIVRELCGVVTAEKADAGIVVSSGGFTTEAKGFAASAGIELIDGQELDKRLGHVASLAGVNALPPIEVSLQQPCPMCGGGMVIRTARRGSNAGRTFLGCQRYPQCRGTRSL